MRDPAKRECEALLYRGSQSVSPGREPRGTGREPCRERRTQWNVSGQLQVKDDMSGGMISLQHRLQKNVYVSEVSGCQGPGDLRWIWLGTAEYSGLG